MKWAYHPKDFERKLNRLGGPDFADQNHASARIWFQTLFKRLKPGEKGFNEILDETLREQQELLVRNLCALSMSKPLIGEQEKWSYEADEKYSVAQLLSGGGRFGYVFEDDELGRKFVNFLVTGREELSFETVVHHKINPKGIKVPIDKMERYRSFGGLYHRISTHDQKCLKGLFCEVKSYVRGIDKAFGMDFPIGGVGNDLYHDGEMIRIGYEGETMDMKYQLGTMLLKFDQTEGRARLMIGFESCAPHRKNPFGGKHNLIATLHKVSRRYFERVIKRLNLCSDTTALLKKDRSLTGQSKGAHLGVFTSYGSNIAMIDEAKFLKFKAMVHALGTMRGEDKEEVVKKLLLSVGEKERDEIFEESMYLSRKGPKCGNSMHTSKHPVHRAADILPPNGFQDKDPEVTLLGKRWNTASETPASETPDSQKNQHKAAGGFIVHQPLGGIPIKRNQTGMEFLPFS